MGLLAVLRNLGSALPVSQGKPHSPLQKEEKVGEEYLHGGGCHHTVPVGSGNSKNALVLLVPKGRQEWDWQCQLLVASETRAGLMEEAWDLEAEAEEDQRAKGGDGASAGGAAMAGQAAQLRDPVEMTM